MHGARIGYFSGDIRTLTEDLMELRPSIFPTVPRLLNRIYDKVRYPPPFPTVPRLLNRIYDKVR